MKFPSQDRACNLHPDLLICRQILMPTTTTVRISYQHRAMLEEGNRAYAKLGESPKDWAEELEERRIWEATLSDGLKAKRRKRFSVFEN